MRILIVEDDLVTRKILAKFLVAYGDCDIAVDGEEAARAFRLAWEAHAPYDLILMDIMMPNVDGHEALARIRAMENNYGVRGSQEVKVIMVTALGDPKTVVESYYQGGATSYIVKPIKKDKLIAEMRKLNLVP